MAKKDFPAPADKRVALLASVAHDADLTTAVECETLSAAEFADKIIRADGVDKYRETLKTWRGAVALLDNGTAVLDKKIDQCVARSRAGVAAANNPPRDTPDLAVSKSEWREHARIIADGKAAEREVGQLCENRNNHVRASIRLSNNCERLQAAIVHAYLTGQADAGKPAERAPVRVVIDQMPDRERITTTTRDEHGNIIEMMQVERAAA